MPLTILLLLLGHFIYSPFDSTYLNKGYEVIAETKGDLDNDGIEEKVVVSNTDKEGEMGIEREIQIFKNNNGKWILWHTSKGAVLPSQHGGVYGDPFSEISIEKGCIVIGHFGGSRQKWHYYHRYRFQNGSWQLIRATVNFGSPCDYWENLDYNLSTGKVVYKKETETCDEEHDQVITKTENKEFTKKVKALAPMDGFYPGNNEIKLPDSDQTFFY
jgi:hypothetical protein